MDKTACLIAAALAGLLVFAAGPAGAGGDPIPVCIAKDGTLRIIEGAGQCRPGEQKKLFVEWIKEVDPPPDKDDASKSALEKKVQELSIRLAALEAAKPQPRPDRTERLEVDLLSRKLDALAFYVETVVKSKGDGKGVAHRVTAPFEVVGSGGVVILRVAEKVASQDGKGARVTIGAGQSGNYAVRVHKDGGTFVAGIGQSTTGAGLAIVMDEAGEIAANMNGTDRRVSVYKGGNIVAGLVAEDRGGTVAVYEGPNAVAFLTKSLAGGNVTARLNSGFGVFSAGAAQDGGGEACVNRVTGDGKKRTDCLGIGLPSMGLGK